MKDYLSKENTLCLKGICAILILIHHIVQNIASLQNTILKFVTQQFGIIVVAIFFFLRGYGLAYQCREKEYADNFLKHKIIPFYIIYLIYAFIYSCAELNISAFFKTALFYNNIIIYGWYLQVQMLFYIFVFISIKISKLMRPYFSYIIWFEIIIYIFISIILGQPYFYYVTAVAFCIGFSWEENRNRIDVIVKKKYLFLIVLSLFFIAVSLMLMKAGKDCENNYIYIISKFLEGVATLTFILLMLKTCKINNKFTLWLGKYSFEIYALQGLVISYTKKMNIYYYLLISFLGTIFLAVLVNRIINLIMNRLRKILC